MTPATLSMGDGSDFFILRAEFGAAFSALPSSAALAPAVSPCADATGMQARAPRRSNSAASPQA
jgi:hypothetical protein